MKTLIKKFFDNEILSYLFFGVATTVVSIFVRIVIFYLTRQELVATALGNIAGILFAFFTNDMFVFNQEKTGMVTRFVKFVGARLLTLVLDLALAYFLVDTYPEIIGQFVGHSHAWVNGIESLFSQVLIIVLNYIISKFFVFTGEKV